MVSQKGYTLDETDSPNHSAWDAVTEAAYCRWSSAEGRCVWFESGMTYVHWFNDKGLRLVGYRSVMREYSIR